ncbi:MAG: hypothetical protein CMO81_07820 [Waddliaceae bacterium]|nr:hypothetical protein [Waddliaceae bacterium]
MMIFCDGSFIDEKEAALPITDRGFLFGDGVFTTLRLEDGNLWNFQAHVLRLKENCQRLGIRFPSIHLEDIQKLAVQNGAEKGLWRCKIIVTGGDSRSLALEKERLGRLLIRLAPYNQEGYKDLSLGVMPSLYQGALQKIKSLSYLDKLQLKQRAIDSELDDILLFSEEKYLLECSFSNLFWVNGTELSYPDPCLNFLHGTSIQHLLHSVSKIGFSTLAKRALLESLEKETQVYTINSLQGLLPVRCIHGRSFATNFKQWQEISRVYKETMPLTYIGKTAIAESLQ